MKTLLLALLALPPAGLFAQAPAPIAYTAERPLIVGIVLFDGFEPLDVFGPVQIFGGLGRRAKIVTLAENPAPARPRFGPAVSVDRTLADAGPLDLLIIPGGTGTRTEVANATLIAALKRLGEATPHVASVSTGAALLARTGLLAGHKATSNKRSFQWVAAQDRSVRWIHAARWVEDGRFATSSGVAAGLDLSLGLVAKLFNRDTAAKIAQSAEYVWHDDPAQDPFAALNVHTATNDPTRKFPLHGVVVDVLSGRNAVLVKHEEVPGIMAAMTMSFKVDSAALGTAKKGTRIDADLYQLDGEWHIDNVKSLPAKP
jgi:putative intracellular protease/amidase/Cu/Ag efflux protein CusF